MNEQERKEKFTPGPWKAHTTLNADWVMTDWSDCGEQENICDLSHSNGGNDVYLIAAAPEMYELLDCIRKSVALDAGIMAGCIARIEPLLKKARGEE